MKRRIFIGTSISACVGTAIAIDAFSVGSAHARSEDKSAGSSDTWQQWRGDFRDGQFSGEWPSSLSEPNLTQQWLRELSPSYSGPIVDLTNVYTTETRDKKSEHVLALNRLTGEKLWESQWDGAMSVPFFAKSNGDWIRSTPALNNGQLLVGGIEDHLVCLNSSSGEKIWEIDFPSQTGSERPAFGCVCSPVIEDGFAYMQAGSGLVKIDMQTGNIVWHVLKDNDAMNSSAFSSPIIRELLGKRQLIIQSRTALMGIDLEDGKVIWQKDIEAFRGMNILTPTVIGSTIFTSSYGGKAWMFSLDNSDPASWKVSQVWENKVQAYMSSPVVIDGFVYLHLRNQRFTCINAQTGEEAWTTRPYGKYWSMITNGKQILALDETGDLRLIEADSNEFKLIDERKVSESETWAHLAKAGNQIFIRHLDGLSAWKWE